MGNCVREWAASIWSCWGAPSGTAWSQAANLAPCLHRVQMAGVGLNLEAHGAAGPYDMMNTGNGFSHPAAVIADVSEVFTVFHPKEAQGPFFFSIPHSQSWSEPALNHNTSLSLCLPSHHHHQDQTESGRETPSTNQASSINGTDDEKISHVSPEAAVLKSENDRLKSAVELRWGFHHQNIFSVMFLFFICVIQTIQHSPALVIWSNKSLIHRVVWR